jgi:hypothetical protein
MRYPKLIRLRAQDLNLDVSLELQELIAPQKFRIERARIGVSRKVGIEFLEEIATDQFGNIYVAFRARLVDGNVHFATYRIGKRKWTAEGRLRYILRRELAEFVTFDDALMSHLQEVAVATYAQRTVELLTGMCAAKIPVAIGGQN